MLLHKKLRYAGIGLLSLTMLLPITAIAAEDGGNQDHQQLPVLATNQYQVTNLVSSTSGVAPVTDPNLVNPWGLARSSGGPWWVSDNNSGLSTLYKGTGAIVPLVVTVPSADPNLSMKGSPTGIVFNGSTGFAIGPNAPAFFIYVTEDGTISGWNPTINKTKAIVVVRQKKSVFKGASIATINNAKYGTQSYLYVADFSRRQIEIFNSNFQRVKWLEQSFDQDDTPEGFAPFNVQNLGGNLFVTYAKQDSSLQNEIDGPGLGFVRVYSPTGQRLMQLERGPWMNAPWGIAIAPSDFGPYSHDILVGNFGSGWIAVFDPETGMFLDYLRNKTGSLVWIDGLWALSPGNDAAAGMATTLYFSAGSNHEQGGLFGSLAALQNPQGNDQ